MSRRVTGGAPVTVEPRIRPRTGRPRGPRPGPTAAPPVPAPPRACLGTSAARSSSRWPSAWATSGLDWPDQSPAESSQPLAGAGTPWPRPLSPSPEPGRPAEGRRCPGRSSWPPGRWRWPHVVAAARPECMLIDALAAVGVAALLLPLAWVRLRGRWLFEWLAAALGYAHPPPRPASDPPARQALLDLVDPGAVVRPAAAGRRPGGRHRRRVRHGGRSRTRRPAGLLVERSPRCRPRRVCCRRPGSTILPCRIQLLLTGVPAPAVRAGGGTPANSYRQLTEGDCSGTAGPARGAGAARARAGPTRTCGGRLSGWSADCRASWAT